MSRVPAPREFYPPFPSNRIALLFNLLAPFESSCPSNLVSNHFCTFPSIHALRAARSCSPRTGNEGSTWLKAPPPWQCLSYSGDHLGCIVSPRVGHRCYYVTPSHAYGRCFSLTKQLTIKVARPRRFLCSSTSCILDKYGVLNKEQRNGDQPHCSPNPTSRGLGLSMTKGGSSLSGLRRQGCCTVRSNSMEQAPRQTQPCKAHRDYGPSSSDRTNNMLQHARVPVFVMMPLDLIAISDFNKMRLRRVRSLTVALRALKLAGVDGVMVDVWWGAVERHAPMVYDWSVYEEFFNMVSEAGLKVQVVLSFHACAESLVDNNNYIGLPLWIAEIGRSNNDIFYKDRGGNCSSEYLSMGIDEVPVLDGRTGVECYEDFMHSFVATFLPLMGSTIVEVTVGLGPAGELRYPAYPFVDGRWRFPGIGEFQCYDKYMLADLREAAVKAGEPDWGYSGPHDAGDYNSSPWDAPFFQLRVGTSASDYGRFFLEWYSGKLIQHADQILSRATKLLKQPLETDPSRTVHLGAKLAGVHWWYSSHSHAAELTAGYYNTSYRDGYEPIAALLARHGAGLNFPCVEMLDREHPDLCFCSPEKLFAQIQRVAESANVPLGGENSMLRFDEAAFDRVVHNTYYWNTRMHRFTFLRMGESLFTSRNWQSFVRFVKLMCCKSQHHGTGSGPGRPGSLCDLCKV